VGSAAVSTGRRNAGKIAVVRTASTLHSQLDQLPSDLNSLLDATATYKPAASHAYQAGIKV
jgi:hypothetical protein